MPSSSRKRGRKEEDPDCSLLQDLLLSIKFPRCSVCELGWFDDDDDGDDIIVQDKSNSNDDQLLWKCKKLLPLPYCNCTTTLLTNSDSIDNVFSGTELNRILQQTRRLDEGQIMALLTNKFCIKECFKKCNNTAMCSECINSFVTSSNDVIEHDYMSETQPNVKFSVGGKCPCCRKKFSARSLNALLGKGKRSSSQEIEMVEWISNVKNTIQFVGFAKKLKSIIRSKLSDDASSNSSTCIPKQTLKKWMDDTEEHLSDECFSDCEVVEPTKRPLTSGYLAPAAGELKQDLLQKDPLFRQECEDLEYIKQLSSTKEGRRELGIEEPAPKQRKTKEETQMEKDERMARELEDELNGRRPKRKSPILDFFQKGTDGCNGKSQSGGSTPGSTPSSIPFRKPRKVQDLGIQKYLRNKLVRTSDSEDSDVILRPLNAPTHTIDDKKEKTPPPPPTPSKQQTDTIEILDSDDDNCARVPILSVSKNAKVGDRKENTSVESDSKNDTSSNGDWSKPSKSNKPSSTKAEVLCINSDDDSMPLQTPPNEIAKESRASSPAKASPLRFRKVNNLDSDLAMGNPPDRAGETKINENSIICMQRMGFSRNECMRSLKEADNDSELAANILLNERIL